MAPSRSRSSRARHLDTSELDAYYARLRGLPAAVIPASHLIVNDEAGTIASDAGRAAPKGPTGDLAANIASRTTTYGADIYSPQRYAGFVEGGTYKDAPQPFLLPAMKRRRTPLRKRLIDVISNAARPSQTTRIGTSFRKSKGRL